jgi:hypothetical protein
MAWVTVTWAPTSSGPFVEMYTASAIMLPPVT